MQKNIIFSKGETLVWSASLESVLMFNSKVLCWQLTLCGNFFWQSPKSTEEYYYFRDMKKCPFCNESLVAQKDDDDVESSKQNFVNHCKNSRGHEKWFDVVCKFCSKIFSSGKACEEHLRNLVTKTIFQCLIHSFKDHTILFFKGICLWTKILFFFYQEMWCIDFPSVLGSSFTKTQYK